MNVNSFLKILYSKNFIDFISKEILLKKLVVTKIILFNFIGLYEVKSKSFNVYVSLGEENK